MQINEGTNDETVSASQSPLLVMSDMEDADVRDNWMPQPIPIPAPDVWIVHGLTRRAHQLEIQIKQLQIEKLRVETQKLRAEVLLLR